MRLYQAYLDKCITVPEIVHRPHGTMKAIQLFVGRPRKLEVEVGFSHYLMLNWINVNNQHTDLLICLPHCPYLKLFRNIQLSAHLCATSYILCYVCTYISM